MALVGVGRWEGEAWGAEKASDENVPTLFVALSHCSRFPCGPVRLATAGEAETHAEATIRVCSENSQMQNSQMQKKQGKMHRKFLRLGFRRLLVVLCMVVLCMVVLCMVVL